MRTLEDLTRFFRTDLAADFAGLEARRRRGQPRWGRFLAGGFLALVLGMGVSTMLRERYGKHPLPMMAAALPMGWLFFGGLIKALRSSVRLRAFEEAFMEKISVRALSFLFPEMGPGKEEVDLRPPADTGMYSSLERVNPRAVYVGRLESRAVQLLPGEWRTYGESRIYPPATLVLVDAAGTPDCRLAARTKSEPQKKIEGATGETASGVLAVDRHREHRRWPDHRFFETGDADFDRAFWALAPKDDPAPEFPPDLRSRLLEVAGRNPRFWCFGLSGGRACLAVEGVAVFLPRQGWFSAPLDPDQVARDFHADARLAWDLVSVVDAPS